MNNQVTVFEQQSYQLDKILKIKTYDVGGIKQDAVNARDLHLSLGSKQQFTDWIKNRLEQNSYFEEGFDYSSLHKVMKRETGATTKKEYILTIETLKSFCFITLSSKYLESK